MLLKIRWKCKGCLGVGCYHEADKAGIYYVENCNTCKGRGAGTFLFHGELPRFHTPLDASAIIADKMSKMIV